MTRCGSFPITAGNTPADRGLLAWAYDPLAAVNNQVLVSAGLYLIKVPVRVPALVTRIYIGVATAGSGLTAGQCYAGLYDAAGNRLGVTADQASAWASNGVKAMDLTAPVSVPAGNYWVALLSNGATGPAVARSVGTAIGNVGLTAGNYQAASYGSGLTAIPTSIPMGSATASSTALWAALA